MFKAVKNASSAFLFEAAKVMSFLPGMDNYSMDFTFKSGT